MTNTDISMTCRKKHTFDLETLPAAEPTRNALLETSLTEAEAEVVAIRPPGNIKKAESIQEWMINEAPLKAAAIREEAREKADEQWRKTALDGTFGRVFCIGYSTNGGAAVAPNLHDFGATVDDIKAGNEKALQAERDMLNAWAAHCAYQAGNEATPQYIGHNHVGFDMPFLFKRAVILNAELPRSFPILAKPWDSDRIFDTMTAWAGKGKYVKMDVLCAALGIALKGSELDGEHIDGSMVVDTVYRGEGHKISTYCCGDVDRTWAMAERIQGALAKLV